MKGWMRTTRAGLLLITGLTAMIYANSLNNSFHYDDYHSIVNNASIRSLKFVPLYFVSRSLGSEDAGGSNYRPLLYSTYAINYAIGQYKVWGYHLVNLTFHILSAWLVYAITRRLTQSAAAALLAGLIFALHPMNAEGINYITARSSLMSSFFILLSFLAYIKHRSLWLNSSGKAGSNGNKANYSAMSWLYYFGSLLALLCAFLTKEVAIIAIGLFILYDLCFVLPKSKIRIGRDLPAYFPLIAASGLFLWWKGLIPSRELFSLYVEQSLLPILTGFKIYMAYLSLLIWPYPLTIDQNLIPVESVGHWETIFSVLGVTALFVVGIALFRVSRILAFCIFSYLIVLSPIAYLAFTTKVALFQENRGYMAVMAFAIGVAWVLAGSKQEEVSSEQEEVISDQSAVSSKDKTQIMDDQSLNTKHQTLATDESPRTTHHAASGGVISDQSSVISKGKTPNTRHSPLTTNHALLKWGFICLILVTYGAIDVHRNTIWRDDVTLWTDAVRKRPYSTGAQYNLGLAYQKVGRWEDSIDKIKFLLTVNPEYPKAHYNLALAYTKIGEWDPAERLYREAVRLDPKDYKAYYNLGWVYEKQGKTELALEAYRQSLKINPNNASAQNKIGWIYQQGENLDLAIQAYQNALKLDPQYVKAKDNLRLATLLQVEQIEKERVHE